jgi:sterol desaturase/sphingolipid hydroxylase (fatty acid hydroxylase superfamily)
MEILLLAAPILLYAGFALAERFGAARHYPAMKLWKTRGVINFAVVAVLSTVVPPLWMPALVHSPLSIGAWPLALQIVIGFVAYQLGSYAYHRTAHNVHAMWRWFHQVHHSAERVDVHGAFMFHPTEILAFALLQTAIPIGLLGVSPVAGALIGVIALFYAVFQHANIHTPTWLGYVIQRPEQHALHHQRGVHAWNYADFPLIDLLFGTFKNPAHAPAEAQAGFWDGASQRVGAMLIGRDVAEPVELTPPARAVAAES